jgi:hypothetical protein
MKALAGAAVLLAALGCAPASAEGDGAIRITLERTACFGVCPVYSVTMREDGSVTYTGAAHVRVTGTHSWKIDAAAVRALAREMETAGFFELKNEYTAPMTDMPTTFTTLTIGSSTKRIKDYYSGPPVLRDLEMRIDVVSGAKGYVALDGRAVREMQAKGWRATGDANAAVWMIQAAVIGDAETLKALIDAGADARAVEAGGGVTLVMRAAESGNPEAVRVVLAAGGDPTARDRTGRNAADRARDGIADPRKARATVETTGRPRDYALILKLLTDE